MILYHSTTLDHARSIMVHGFRTSDGPDGPANHDAAGVWLSTPPVDIGEGGRGISVISVDLALPEEEIGAFELLAHGGRYREFLLPAHRVNAHARISLVNGQDPADLTAI